jgi:DNA polymerase IV
VFVRASILHADLDAFYASVAQRDDPSLRGKPVVVGGGVVLAASYEARAFGVRSAMGARERRRLCPQAVVAPSNWEACLEASRAVREIFRETGAEVRPVSIDEAFLDVRRLDRSSWAIGAEIRHAVRTRVGLPITVGGGTSRLVAKMAGAAAKPDGLRIVEAGDERAFMHPLPLTALWGLGPRSAEKLHARGWRTVGDLAELDEQELVAVLGRGQGVTVHALAHDRELRPVKPRRGRRSFGAQSALGRPVHSPDAFDAALRRVVERVGSRMAKADRVGRTVVLRLRFGDYSRATRSQTLPVATSAVPTLLAAGRDLLAEVMPGATRRGLTLVGITVTNLDAPAPEGQLSLEVVP